MNTVRRMYVCVVTHVLYPALFIDQTHTHAHTHTTTSNHASVSSVCERAREKGTEKETHIRLHCEINLKL